MHDKTKARLRRAKKTRMRIRRQEIFRLTVHRTANHIYAQITTADGAKVFAAASTLMSEISSDLKVSGNIAAAAVVGQAIAKKALAIGIDKVAFDRSGFGYHGRIKSLAEAARDSGLQF